MSGLFRKSFVIVSIIMASAMIVILLLVFNITKSSAKTKGIDGYILIDSVPGAAFEVSQNLTDYATAVLAISKDVDFVKNASYSYKNGMDQYMLFNMSQFIIVAKKGTSFNLANTDIKTSLETNSLAGIWFENGTNLEKRDGKCVLDVNAQAVITNTIYNNFSGKLSTVTVDGEEWALFVGIVNPNDNAMAEMVKNTISTFRADDSIVGYSDVVYEIPTEDEPKLRPIEIAQVSMPKADAVISEIEPADTEEKIDASSDVEAEETEEPKTIEELKTEEITEETTDDTVEAPVEASPVEEIEVSDEMILNAGYNQKLPDEYKEEAAYTSSVYSMLSAGTTGYASAMNQDTGIYDEIFVRVDSINNEETTNRLIKEYIRSGDAYYTEMDAPAGTHWESITYSAKYDEGKDYYINVLFVGLDGEKLKYRGISYSQKTYDILNRRQSSNGWETGYVAFFAVPNGCDEYVIAIGDTVEDMGYKAYYRKKGKRF